MTTFYGWVYNCVLSKLFRSYNIMFFKRVLFIHGRRSGYNSLHVYRNVFKVLVDRAVFSTFKSHLVIKVLV